MVLEKGKRKTKTGKHEWYGELRGWGARTAPAADAPPTVASQASSAAGAAWRLGPFKGRLRSACMLNTVSVLQDWPQCRMRLAG